MDSIIISGLTENEELLALILEQRCIMNIRRRAGWLCNLLQKHKAIIAGSFILQCLLDESYDGDIDVYVPFTNPLPRLADKEREDEIRDDLLALPEGEVPLFLNGRPLKKVEVSPAVSFAHSRNLYIQPNRYIEKHDPKHLDLATLPQLVEELNHFRVLRYLGFDQGILIWTADFGSIGPVQDLEEEIYKKSEAGSTFEESGLVNDYPALDLVYATRTFEVGREDINVVVVEDPLRTINDNFDMDLCSMYFDGERLGNFHLWRRAFFKVMRFRMHESPGRQKQTRIRLRKYKKREYALINSPDFSY